MPARWYGAIVPIPRDLVPVIFLHMPEKLLQQQTDRWAKDAAAIGVAGYHTYRSERSNPGFPDWVFQVGDRTYYVELKGWQPSSKAHGKPTQHQMDWLTALSRNPSNHVYLCYPWHWPALSTEMWEYQWKFNKQREAYATPNDQRPAS